jgi:hypothetical protein
MLVGASFAYGWGVSYEDTLLGRLELALRARGFGEGKRLEFVNAGVPSLPENAQQAWFAATGRSYQPDLVLQLEYGTLAIPDAPRPAASADGYLVRANATSFDRLRERAKRFATVFYGFLVYSKLRSQSQVAGAGRVLPTHLVFAEDAPEVRGSLAYFAEMQRLAESAGARFLVLYYPLSYVIHPQDVERWRHLGVQDPAAQEAFDGAVCAELARRGVACANGTAALRAAAQQSDERLYYWVDIHWTARGNAAAAEHAARAVEQFWARAAPAAP